MMISLLGSLSRLLGRLASLIDGGDDGDNGDVDGKMAMAMVKIKCNWPMMISLLSLSRLHGRFVFFFITYLMLESFQTWSCAIHNVPYAHLPSFNLRPFLHQMEKSISKCIYILANMFRFAQRRTCHVFGVRWRGQDQSRSRFYAAQRFFTRPILSLRMTPHFKFSNIRRFPRLVNPFCAS